MAVGVVEPARGLLDDRQDVIDLHPPVVAQDLGAGLALDVLHDDVVPARLLVKAGIEHLHDVRVDEPGGGLGLALEARDECRVVGEMLGEELHGHEPFQARVQRAVHRRHPAVPEAAFEPVAAGDHLCVHGAAAPPAPLPWPLPGAAVCVALPVADVLEIGGVPPLLPAVEVGGALELLVVTMLLELVVGVELTLEVTLELELDVTLLELVVDVLMLDTAFCAHSRSALADRSARPSARRACRPASTPVGSAARCSCA